MGGWDSGSVWKTEGGLNDPWAQRNSHLKQKSNHDVLAWQNGNCMAACSLTPHVALLVCPNGTL